MVKCDSCPANVPGEGGPTHACARRHAVACGLVDSGRLGNDVARPILTSVTTWLHIQCVLIGVGGVYPPRRLERPEQSRHYYAYP